MQAIPTNQIIIMDEELRRAQNNCVHYLLSLEPERFLYEIYKVAELDPLTEEGYQGWERSDKMNFRGHFFGHYISSLSLALGNVKEEEVRTKLLDKLTIAVKGLRNAQIEYGKKHPTSYGYVSAFREVALDEVEGLPVDPKEKENVLVPWYNLHKILAGLTAAYEALRVTSPNLAMTALETASAFGDYVYQRMLTMPNKEKMLTIEYGGMNDGLYQLFSLTKRKEHLIAASYFDEVHLFKELADDKDVLAGKHANTMIPKFIGALKRYTTLQVTESAGLLSRKEVEELPVFLKAAENFWDIVIKFHTYSTGGNSQSEHFHEANTLFNDAEIRNGDCTCETCNTHNMLKLSRELFKVTGNKKYLDYYEKTYINAILASQNPDNGMMMYFQPMGAGYNKVYNRPFDEFWCCTGTGIESFSKLSDSFYFVKENTVFVNLYFSNEVIIPNANVKLIQQVNRSTGEVSLLFSKQEDTTFEPINLRLRQPEWVSKYQTFNINGIEQTIQSTNGFWEITVEEEAHIEFTLYYRIKLISANDNKDYISLNYGPYVLSAHLGQNKIWEDMPNGVLVRVATRDPLAITTLTTKIPIDEWRSDLSLRLEEVKMKDKLIAFKVKDIEEDLIFSPYYQMHGERYGIYFQLQEKDSEAAQSVIKKQKERERENSLIMDQLFNFDDNNSEYAKHLEKEKSTVSSWWGHRYRVAERNGEFSYLFHVDPSVSEIFLELKFIAEDAGKSIIVRMNEETEGERMITVPAVSEKGLLSVKLVIENKWKKEKMKLTFRAPKEEESCRLFGITLRNSLSYSNVASIKGIKISGGILVPYFNPNTKMYMVKKETNKILAKIDADPAVLVYVNNILIDEKQPRDITDTAEIKITTVAADRETSLEYTLKIENS
ncbi:beta-L-arabinofuranosidase domain-containing protein [Niallia sp.]|uniref:beta-L-arabinofuranosidase domain-containing protein n=1 Tax=Niallia sp. TaxID=2837523 RepID=UPI00289C6098|nr:beta-L-arabinofuranosidase domain-containing protein [Niallia sp.]